LNGDGQDFVRFDAFSLTERPELTLERRAKFGDTSFSLQIGNTIVAIQH
jgi:hypothetical protein